jgi:ankyrin repeat protein
VVTAEDIGGRALHIAAFLDSANATYELLLLGADILLVDARGRNPLDIAKDRPTSPVLHILLEHQSTMNTDETHFSQVL